MAVCSRKIIQFFPIAFAGATLLTGAGEVEFSIWRRISASIASGLLRGVLADVAGSEVPKVPGWRADWAEASGRPLFRAASEYLLPVPHDPRPGDVAAFRMGRREAHVGIFAPGGRVIHAAETVGVVEVPVGPLADRIVFRAAFPKVR